MNLYKEFLVKFEVFNLRINLVLSLADNDFELGNSFGYLLDESFVIYGNADRIPRIFELWTLVGKDSDCLLL